jgi:hypothetical protein
MRHPSWRYLQTEGSYSLIPNSLMAVALSGQVPGWEGTLSPIARLVLLALASRARLRVKSADEKELAALLGVDPRTARKALMDLWEAGLVEVDSPGRYRLAGGSRKGGTLPCKPCAPPCTPCKAEVGKMAFQRAISGGPK